MNSVEKRDCFRIIYPIVERPGVYFGKKRFEVIDISQGGIKYAIEDAIFAEEWPKGLTVEAEVKLLCGVSQKITGKVLRVSGVHVILLLEPKIPLKIMLDEQRKLINKYGIS